MPNVLEMQLEDYVLEEEFGRGDLTIVYRGRRKVDDAEVAIKIVAPQFTFDELFVRRFKDIAWQTTKLEHPNIVRTYEARQEGNLLYIVRELIEARPLAQVLEEEGPFTPYRMLMIGRQIASALDYAHQKSITHGDLSAHRVYLNANDRVTVADFGQTQAMAGTSLVKQGYAIGSPEVMAPERVRGQGANRQSDLYSLGILCYQMLAGEPPFTGPAEAVLHAQAYEQPRSLRLVNPAISIPLSEAIDRVLSKGLELRYNTGAEFARALAVAIEGTAPVRVPAAVAQKKEAGLASNGSWWKRPWVWLLAIVPVVGLLLGVGFWLISVWHALQPAIMGPSAVPAAAVTAVKNEPGQAATATVPSALAEVATAPTVALSPSPTPPPTVTPTMIPLPTPGPPVITADSPFTTLRLARQVTADNLPAQAGTSFAPGSQPIYLFFDYQNIQPGTAWTHRWTWADTELDVYQDVWPENYASSGTAWVYYSPTGGYQPGPYKVTLEVNGQVVGTATFVVETGGL